MENTFTHNWKIILAGDANVGKTHLLNRYVRNMVPANAVPTVGAEFMAKSVSLSNGETAKIQFWDTAGQEKFRSIVTYHFRKAVGAMIVYDVTDPNSFENLKIHIESIRQNANQDVVIMLVGNKTDLETVNRVDQEKAMNFAKDVKCLYEETSALTNQNVNKSFEQLIEEVLKVMANKPSTIEAKRLSVEGQIQKKKGCC